MASVGADAVRPARSVDLEKGVDVEEVARAGAATESKDLVRGKVVGVKNIADVEGDALPKSAAVGEDFDQDS